MKPPRDFPDRPGPHPTDSTSSATKPGHDSLSSSTRSTTSTTWTSLLPNLHFLLRVSPSFMWYRPHKTASSSPSSTSTTPSPPSTPTPLPSDSHKSLYSRVSQKVGLPTKDSKVTKKDKAQSKRPKMPATIKSSDCLAAAAGKTAANTYKPIKLSAWDQAAMRGYIRVCLCFPFDHSRLDEAVSHLKASLTRLAEQRPDFSGDRKSVV